jgi:putative DNA primase/helicase
MTKPFSANGCVPSSTPAFDLHHLAAAVGRKVHRSHKIGPHLRLAGPGHSTHDDSLIVIFDPSSRDGFRTHSHAGDPWQECRRHVLELAGLPMAPITSTPRGNDERALAIWDAAQPIAGTLAERYLNERAITDMIDSNVARFHPKCPFGKGRRLPALVVPFRRISDGAFAAIQRTALNPDGTKIDRWALGPTKGAAMMIAPIAGGVLTVGEGFETTVSARDPRISTAAGGLWALGGKDAIGELPVLAGVRKLLVLIDAEAWDAAGRAEARWRAAGREVALLDPPGGDYNDWLRQLNGKPPQPKIAVSAADRLGVWCEVVSRDVPRLARLVTILARHMRQGGGCLATNDLLAEETGLPLRTVERYLRRLASIGAVTVEVGCQRRPGLPPVTRRLILPGFAYARL